jgi:CheY-like chemotaxis protein
VCAVKAPLNILLLEDSRFDAELIAVELKRLGRPFNLETIKSETELRRSLDFQPPDIILSDHGLPSFDGFRALTIVRQERPELPFIFVSGSNNQQMVVDMFDRGATDYVYKRDLVDLCPAIQRALTEPPVIREPDEFSEPRPHVLVEGQTVSSNSCLQFCPKCQRTRDEAGHVIEFAKYLSSFPEATIRRQICAGCALDRRSFEARV